jgi:hypothetical protein
VDGVGGCTCIVTRDDVERVLYSMLRSVPSFKACADIVIYQKFAQSYLTLKAFSTKKAVKHDLTIKHCKHLFFSPSLQDPPFLSFNTVTTLPNISFPLSASININQYTPNSHKNDNRNKENQ